MSDVTIPASEAAEIAEMLRTFRECDAARLYSAEKYTRMADLLGPPALSLRDEVAKGIENSQAHGYGPDAIADCVLAVVRRHVEDTYVREGYPNLDGLTPQGCYSEGIGRVVRLLGGDE